MEFRKYTVILLVVFAVSLTIVPLLNWIVDPFWYFRSFEISGFNKIKPSYHLYEREVKSAYVRKIHPQVIISGSSFSEIGFPAKHPGLTDNGKLSAYNLSLPWSQGNELYCYSLFALHQQGLRKLILGGFALEEYKCDKYSDLGHADYANLLLSKNAFIASINTIFSQHDMQVSSEDGMWTYQRYSESFKNDNDVLSNFASSLKNLKCDFPVRDKKLQHAYALQDHGKSAAKTAGLRKIVQLAIKNNIQLILVDFPKHVLLYEQERECGRLEQYFNRLSLITSTIEEQAGSNSNLVQFWTFYGYQAINAEPIFSGIPMKNRTWQDSGHFNPEVGYSAFDSIFERENDFGFRLTSSNVASFISSKEQERLEFLKRNPWVHKELDELRNNPAFLR